jgi:hypothetical protein
VAEDETIRRRRLNENRRALFGTTQERTVAFICECGDPRCRETVLLSGSQFEARTKQGALLVHPQHAHVVS